MIQGRSIVTPLESELIPRNGLTITPFEEILEMPRDSDFLVDVIGLLTAVGDEKEFQRDGKLGKMIVIELSCKSLKLECALFSDYVDCVTNFLAGGYLEQPVVVLQLVKVKLFKGKISLQNVIHATKIMFNPDIAEAFDFRRGILDDGVFASQPLVIRSDGARISLEDDFMRITPRLAIDGLSEVNEDGVFVVLATIKNILENGSWWYTACVCGKSLEIRDGVHHCKFCHHYVVNVSPRFRIEIEVEDHSGLTVFVLFDREASYLYKRACIDVFAQVQNDETAIRGTKYPEIFSSVVGRKLLFKVQTKKPTSSIYYETFAVRRICDDPTIISMFELDGAEMTPSKALFAPSFPSIAKEIPPATSNEKAEAEEFVSQVLKSTLSCQQVPVSVPYSKYTPAKRNLEIAFECASASGINSDHKVIKDEDSVNLAED